MQRDEQPSCLDGTAAALYTEQREMRAGKAIRILVIEDNAAVREEVADILNFEGFEVREAANRRIGLDLIRQARPDRAVMETRTRAVQAVEAEVRDLRERLTLTLPDELHAPLHCITGYADLLTDPGSCADPDEVAEFAQRIRGAGLQLCRIERCIRP